MKKPVTSPLSGEIAYWERSIETEPIISGYKREFGLDIKKYFHNLYELEIYRCQKTGYRFYYPFDITGDSFFYEQLEKFPWYYMEWKWEHEIAINCIKKADKVLEIGCGNGSFIKQLVKNGINATGLELNEKTIKEASIKNLPIMGESIENHATKEPGGYDFVCSFQVLEHIPDVKSFLEASVKSLKPGGRLFISVPNNDSFIKHPHKNLLNLPPHHMGLWNKKSLELLGSTLKIKKIKIIQEPLQTYHRDLYYNTQIDRIPKKLHLLKKLLNTRIPKGIARRILTIMAPNIKGQSIVAIYQKPLKDETVYGLH